MNIIGILFSCFIIFIILINGSCSNPQESFNPKSAYKMYCSNCHGLDGSLGTNGAINLKNSALPLDERILVIRKGRGIMTGFETILDDLQIKQIAEFTMSLNDSPENAK